MVESWFTARLGYGFPALQLSLRGAACARSDKVLISPTTLARGCADRQEHFPPSSWVRIITEKKKDLLPVLPKRRPGGSTGQPTKNCELAAFLNLLSTVPWWSLSHLLSFVLVTSATGYPLVQPRSNTDSKQRDHHHIISVCKPRYRWVWSSKQIPKYKQLNTRRKLSLALGAKACVEKTSTLERKGHSASVSRRKRRNRTALHAPPHTPRIRRHGKER